VRLTVTNVAGKSSTLECGLGQSCAAPGDDDPAPPGDDDPAPPGDDDPAPPGDNDTTPPAVSFTLTNTSSGPWTRYNVDWTAIDNQALASIVVELLNGQNVVDRVTTSLSGTSASGTSTVRTRGSVTGVRVIVTDAAGNEVTESRLIP